MAKMIYVGKKIKKISDKREGQSSNYLHLRVT